MRSVFKQKYKLQLCTVVFIYDIYFSKQLKISKEYVWSKRETTPEGAPLAELVEHGIQRVKYACDVVDALVNEIKILSNSKQ